MAQPAIYSNFCYICGVELTDSFPCTDTSRTRDHYIPKIAGGTNNFLNLRWACRSCNLAKGAYMPSDSMFCVLRFIRFLLDAPELEGVRIVREVSGVSWEQATLRLVSHLDISLVVSEDVSGIRDLAISSVGVSDPALVEIVLTLFDTFLPKRIWKKMDREGADCVYRSIQ